MIISEHPQRTPGWRADKVGMLSTSEFHRLLSPAKLEPSSQSDEYLAKKAAEWWLGMPLETFRGTQWTERGENFEPEARMAFAVSTGYFLRDVGFIRRTEDDLVGTSFDSLVLDQDVTDPAFFAKFACGSHEMKCPAPWTHAKFCRWVEETGTVPRDHHLQVQGQLWVTGLRRAWFQSYYPDPPDGSRAPQCLIEVAPDPRVQDALSEHIPSAVARLLEWRDWYRSHGCEPRDPYEWADAQDLESSEWEGAA